jgi:NAD(P)H-quinone oxidoreductase subunit 5
MTWDADSVAIVLCHVIVLAPLSALVATAAIAAFEAPVNERVTNRITQASIAAGLLGGAGIMVLMLVTGQNSLRVELGSWASLPREHFRFAFTFLFDRLSVAFLLLSLILSGVVGAFARVYLHREPGYRRFYLLFTLFVLGMSVSSIAGTIEILFAGWEFVGISSALLIGFFQERPAPVANGQRVWAVYRFADAAFLAAAVALHHAAAGGDFARMTGSRVWPEGVAQVTGPEALVVGSLLLFAAAGKSGLVPFSGWLPRAMEGPTPSSAIFYGALSVHLGAFLLLRMEALLDLSLPLRVMVTVLGLATAVWSTVAMRVESDIKSVMAFASLTQVGLIVAEIGLGFRLLALLHIAGNASLRTLQLLRAPSLLHEYHQIESALGAHPRPGGEAATGRLARMFYRVGYERSFFDDILERFATAPLTRLLSVCETWERRWQRRLSGRTSPVPPDPPPHLDSLEPWR